MWGMLRSLLPKVLHGVHQHLKSSKKWEAKASLSLRTSEPLAYTKLFAAALQHHNAHVGSLLRGAKKALWHEAGFPSSSASTSVWDRSWWPLRPAFPAAARVRPPTLQPRTPLAVCDFWKSRSISPSFMFLDCIKGKRPYIGSPSKELPDSCPSPDPEYPPGQVEQRTVPQLVMLSSYPDGCSMRSRLGLLPPPPLPMPGLTGLVLTPTLWHHRPPSQLLALGLRSL